MPGVPRMWSTEKYAEDLALLLADPLARADRIAALQLAIERHTWADFARALASFFERITGMPEGATSAIGADSAAADAAALSAVLSSRSWRAAERLRRIGRFGRA